MDDAICQVFIAGLLIGYSAILVFLVWWSLGFQFRTAKRKILHWLHLDRRERIVPFSSNQWTTPYDHSASPQAPSHALVAAHNKLASSSSRTSHFASTLSKPRLKSKPEPVSKLYEKNRPVIIAEPSSFDQQAVTRHTSLIIDTRKIVRRHGDKEIYGH